MDRDRFSAIAHRNHVFCNPMSPAKVDKVVDLLSLDPDARVIDIGAGKGELLLRVVEKYGCQAVAIELNDEFIAEMRSNAMRRELDERIEIIREDANISMQRLNGEAFDVAVCIGSSHIFGGYAATLARLAKAIRLGGYLVMGELYWKREPCEEYLKALGSAEADLLVHAQNVLSAEQYGLIPLWSSVASDDDWDAYEWLYSMSVENYCHQHPQDPDTPAMLDRIRAWREIFLKWGRDMLGFGLYLFRRV